MENKQTMNVSVLKHTGKSVMSDDSSKRISIKMLETNPQCKRIRLDYGRNGQWSVDYSYQRWSTHQINVA